MKKLLLIFVIAAVALLGWKYRAALDPEVLRDWIQGFGAAGPFLYVLLYALNTVTLMPPIAILSLAAGLAFGKGIGFIALMGGALLGTTATFFLSRYLGRGFVEKRIQGRFKSLDEKLGQRGFPMVLFFRAVPIVPYEVLNYVAGLSKIRFRDYFWATLLGFIPGVTISVFFGDSLASLRSHPERFILALVALILLFVIPIVYMKVRRRPQHGTD